MTKGGNKSIREAEAGSAGEQPAEEYPRVDIHLRA